MPIDPSTPRRYRSIAGLVRVVPARQLIPFWLAIGLTFANFGFLVDVMARGSSLPRRTDEQCPLHRGCERDQIASDENSFRRLVGK